MSQLVGVPHDVDSGDFSAFDFERGCLKFTIRLQRYETRQTVDESSTNKFRAILSEMNRQNFMDLHDSIEAEDRLHGGRTLAAAVRMNADIGRQHLSKRFHVAVARRGEESLGK